MTDDILHIILTRFNVRSGGREKMLRQDPAWLDSRFRLFRKYCWPSVTGQSRRDFVWLVFFDAETPRTYRDEISEKSVEFPGFKPVFTEEWSTEVVRRALEEQRGTGHGRLLTTRLDNDDGIHADFVQTLRQKCDAGGPGFYNFPNGCILSRQRLYSHRDLSNPFLSLLEEFDGYQTVWQRQHHEIAANFKVMQVELPFAWLQVVHGRNVSNRIRGARISGDDVFASYPGLSRDEFQAVGGAAIAVDRLIHLPVRRCRDSLIVCAKRLLRRH